MVKLIWGAIYSVISILFLIISILSFMEKGFVFHNAYIWASKQDREKMDKKPYYRQAATTFALSAVLFATLSLEIIFETGWLWLIVVAAAGAVLVYAVASCKKGQ